MRGFRCRSSLKKSDPPEKPLDQSAISLFFLAASPIVASAFVRRQVGLRPTKLLVAREKKTSGTQGCQILVKCFILLRLRYTMLKSNGSVEFLYLTGRSRLGQINECLPGL